MNDIEILELYANTENKYAGSIEIEIKEAIENLIQRNKDLEQIEKEHKEENGKLREEIDKKDKIINLMAEEIVNGVYKFRSKKQVINYFTNKVEEDIKE